MTSVHDVTVAARVPVDLRERLEQASAAMGDADLSVTIRRYLRAGAELELKRNARIDLATLEQAVTGGLFGPRPGARRRRDRATSTAAALDVQPRSGSQRHRALWTIANRGSYGATADEVIHAEQMAGRPVAVNGMARRVTDLYQAGAIAAATEPAGPDAGDLSDANWGIPVPDGHVPVTRATRNGSQATVYVVTSKGLTWLGHPPTERTS